ncbi:Bacterial extracellular solute-binding protein, family 3 [compost metagenome]
MGKFIFFKVLCLSLLVSSAWAKETLRVSVFHFPPHVFSEHKVLPTGPGVEFIQEYLLPEKNWTISWRTTDFARILEDLKNNKTDVAMYYSKTPDREKIVSYSETSLMTTVSAVIVKKDSTLDFSKPERLPKNLILSRNIGTVIPESFKKAGVRFEDLRGEDIFNRSIQLIRTGRTQGYYIPTKGNALYELEKQNLSKEFKVLQVPGEPLELYVIFRKDLPRNQIDVISRNLQEHRERYQKLLQKRYPFQLQPELKWHITTR